MNYLLLSLIKTAVVVGVLMHTLAYLQWIERKVIAHVQLRVGPRRVGPHGLLQPLADVIKLITKEGMMPSHVNKVFYLLAPFIAVTFALISISVIPFGPIINVGGVKTGMELTDLNIGILFILGISGMGVYGVALAGWASNNKYALLGGLRSSAQMISYELPMALAIASPLLILNTLSFRQIVEKQSFYYFGFIPNWSIFHSPFPQIFAFLIFVIAAFAETNRVPFDLPEAENELVAGFHTEYSSMKFASFFMAEYANMVTVSCVATLLFLGGWQPPFPVQYGSGYIPVIIHLIAALVCFYHAANPARPFDRITLPVFGVLFLVIAGVFLIPVLQPVLLPLFWFGAKVGAILFVFIWIRATLPRFRYDQLMKFAWLFLFPVAMINLFATSLAVALTAK
ncbi:MAG: NADH-quinone oxidoreductase subunit H [Bryobacterales bacterium]|nr:NADH-quinone oxidoreductase subunit H [Bryobacterales bacterium]MBV9397954.1 NADH-quinone oxidoreductase subunit H [Bryobacterales bacterium]